MPDNHALVVLDINLFVAAYWAPRSASARIIQACIDGELRALYTSDMQRGVLSILKQIKLPESYMDYVQTFWEHADLIDPIKVDDVPIEDPEDRKFLEAAAGGNADFLVTNDDHLLKVRYLGRTEILTPSSLARMLGL